MPNTTIITVWSVTVAGRDDGLYLFTNLHDAERFNLAVESNGGSATVKEEPVNHGAIVVELIAAEGEDDE